MFVMHMLHYKRPFTFYKNVCNDLLSSKIEKLTQGPQEFTKHCSSHKCEVSKNTFLWQGFPKTIS